MFLRIIVLMTCGFLMGNLVIGPALQVHLSNNKVSPAYIPYCWAKDHGLYLPCMYSSKEYAA